MMEKKIYFGSNLKMYKTVQETTQYLKELQKYTENIRQTYQNVKLFILPSYTALQAASNAIDQNKIQLGAQNMCWEEEGQFTGEISPRMLEEFNITLTMIGHSERRHVFGESDTEENKKVLRALQHDFTALLCVGETDEEKEQGRSKEVLRRQISVGLSGVSKSDAGKIWIAYEPVWSIGTTGTPASAEYAEEMHGEIRNILMEIFKEEGENIPILYGGSVNKNNACGLIVQPHIDGLYVGRAAWEAKAFSELIKEALAANNETY